jgi:drug/metabolite transporter (DMT)-like permease
MMRKSSSYAYFALIIAIIGFTGGAPSLKLAQLNGVPTSVIITGRLLLCTLAFTPIIWSRYRTEIRQLNKQDLGFIILGGVCFFAHLILIIESLRFTRVVFNQVIGNTGPIWVALLEVFLLGVVFSRRVWWGLGIAILGSVLILWVGLNSATNNEASNVPLGNFLALIAAVLGAFYTIIGRTVRKKVTTIPYLWIMYGVAGILSVLYNLVMQIPLTGYTTSGYFWIVMVAIFPTLLGHTAFNYALGYISGTIVALSGQVVTFTATLIAVFAFGEIPTIGTIIASLVIVTGVVMAVMGQHQHSKATIAPETVSA